MIGITKTPVFEYNDGNTGSVKTFDSIYEALDWADYMWYHLSKSDRRRYTDAKKGGMFIVGYMDEDGNMQIYRDWSEEDEDNESEEDEDENMWTVFIQKRVGDSIEDVMDDEDLSRSDAQLRAEYLARCADELDLVQVSIVRFEDEDILKEEIVVWEAPKLTEIVTTKKVTHGGHALNLCITKEAQALGVDKGDWVEVTIRRVK